MVAVILIVSATPLFTLLMTFLYFRRETITWRTVATIVSIVPGVIVVALSGGGRLRRTRVSSKAKDQVRARSAAGVRAPLTSAHGATSTSEWADTLGSLK